MSEDKGFTVRDRRRVKLEGEQAETVQGPERTEDDGPRGAEAKSTQEAGSGRGGALPPVDFTGFVLGLGQMALVHLGEIPEPSSGNTSRDLDQARHTIDLLDMLEEKTRGNLSENEARLLQGLKADLKLKYVYAARQG